MASDEEFNQAYRSFGRRENLPAELTSEQWSAVPREIRERSFFMSRIIHAETLQVFRTGVEDILSGKRGYDQVEKEIRFWLQDQGFEPPPGKEGGLEDISSLVRIRTVLNTNIDMARGHARWARQQLAIKEYPVLRLLRVSPREEKRPWIARWKEAMAKLGDKTQAIAQSSPDASAADPLDTVICAAPLNDPIWSEISVFNQPYPPFDWDSGVGVEPQSMEMAKAMGFKFGEEGASLEPKVQSLNEELEATPKISDPVLRQSLEDSLGRFGEWDGKKMIFTDPDGTRKMSAEKLAEVWAKPAPKGYDILTQRDELEKWDGGATPDEQDSRIILRKLFDRIVTAEQPPELWRAFAIDPAQAVALIRGLAARRLTIPANVAGWDWLPRLAQALAIHEGAEGAWTVIINAKGVKTAKDLSALRPGKPGFVYVGGTEFKVVDFKQDVRTRRITITLEEA